jgi:ferredoxin
MPCIQACESGALRFAPDGTVAPIAVAVFDLDKCLNEQGIICDTCARHCPTAVKAIRMVGRNVSFDSNKCTGCGLCAYHCEAEPAAFSILMSHPETQI